MKPEDLDAIEARANSVIEGPWEATENCGHGVRDLNGMYVVAPADDYDVLTREEAVFIANARADVPALVAEVRRLRAVLERIAADDFDHHDFNCIWINTAEMCECHEQIARTAIAQNESTS